MPSITIRDVPSDVHRALTVRAARSGRSLQEFLRSELVGVAARADIDDLIERVRARKMHGGAVFRAEDLIALRDEE